MWEVVLLKPCTESTLNILKSKLKWFISRHSSQLLYVKGCVCSFVFLHQGNISSLVQQAGTNIGMSTATFRVNSCIKSFTLAHTNRLDCLDLNSYMSDQSWYWQNTRWRGSELAWNGVDGLYWPCVAHQNGGRIKTGCNHRKQEVGGTTDLF